MSLEFIVFTGLPASGKSTFYRERFASTHVQVSMPDVGLYSVAKRLVPPGPLVLSTR